jgi:hypothetical protein
MFRFTTLKPLGVPALWTVLGSKASLPSPRRQLQRSCPLGLLAWRLKLSKHDAFFLFLFDVGLVAAALA